MLGTIMRKRLDSARAVMAITIAMVAMLVGMGLGSPERAMAATIQKDGFQGVGPTDIVIDVDMLSSENAQYTLPSGWGRTRVDGNSYGLYVKMNNSYLGKTQSWPPLTIRFPRAATNARGDILDLVMTVTPTIKMGHHSESVVDPHDNACINVVRLLDREGPETDLPWFDCYIMNPSTGEYMVGGNGELRAPGGKYATTVKFVRTGTDTLAEGSYAMYMEDIDQPDNTTPAKSWTGPYHESVTLGSNMNKTVHALSNTTLTVNGDDIYGTARTNAINQQPRSGFATRCGSQFSFEWHGSSAGTELFKPVAYPSGNLTVRKQVSNNSAEPAPSFAFTVSFSGTYAPDPISFTLADGQSYTIQRIPEGVTATVTEATPSEYAATWSPSNSVQVANGSNNTITCTNTRRTGNIHIKKTAVGTDGGTAGIAAGVTWPFTVTIYNKSNAVWHTESFNLAPNGERSINNIPSGYRYVVNETPGNLYDLSWSNKEGTVGAGTTTNVTATNNRRYGRLDVKKTAVGTDGANAGIRADARWQFDVKIYDENRNLWKNETFWLAKNEVKSFERIPTTYTYTVTETPNTLYDTSITNPSGTIQHNVTSTATATNTRRYGNLRVRKVANGTDANDSGLRSDARWHFNVVIRDDYGNVWKNESFWLTRNEERVIERIPTTYTYTVTEDADNLYDTNIDNATNYIRHNDTQTATATNNRRYGQLEVKKTARGTDVADSGIRPDERWEFRVMILDDDGHAWKDETFWLTRNETKLFERIPTTYTYRVFESEHPLYDSSSTGEAGVIANRETSKANFENQRRHGRLEVRKKANGTNASDSGVEADAKWRFDVTIRDDYGNTWKHASFLLARDEVKAFEDIPTTYTYEVSESADSQYETTWNDRTGMIEKNTTSSCVATNRRLEGSFVVRKVVDRSRITDKTLDADRAFEIRVSLNDDKRRPVSGTYGDMTFVNGECMLRLKDGEASVATDVPTDWTWGVQETAPDQYALSGIENRTGAVQDNKRAQVVVTNEQLPGGALVNKVTK